MDVIESAQKDVQAALHQLGGYDFMFLMAIDMLQRHGIGEISVDDVEWPRALRTTLGNLEMKLDELEVKYRVLMMHYEGIKTRLAEVSHQHANMMHAAGYVRPGLGHGYDTWIRRAPAEVQAPVPVVHNLDHDEWNYPVASDDDELQEYMRRRALAEQLPEAQRVHFESEPHSQGSA